MINQAYVIKVKMNNQEKYLFSTRLLVECVEFARKFNEKNIAEKYITGTELTTNEYEIIKYVM